MVTMILMVPVVPHNVAAADIACAHLTDSILDSNGVTTVLRYAMLSYFPITATIILMVPVVPHNVAAADIA